MTNRALFLLKMLRALLLRMRRTYDLMKYDDFTIADYFRKQGAVIGENNRLMIRDLGAEAYLIAIGSHCTIASGVMLIVHDGAGWIFTEENPDVQKFGRIEILDNCFVGVRAIILPNTKIGPNSIVGAGSVVTKDVSPNTVVGGNPAREICSIDQYKKKIFETWRRQKPLGYFSEVKNGVKYHPRSIEKMKIHDMSLLEDHLRNLFNKEGNFGGR